MNQDKGSKDQKTRSRGLVDLERMRFRLYWGRYGFFWRLLALPLAHCWRRHLFPLTIDWWIEVKNPESEMKEMIAQNRLYLLEHPEDAMSQFVLGNGLRMDGQIDAAREQYRHVALMDQGHWGKTARDMLAKLEGVADRQPDVSYHIVYRKYPRLYRRKSR